MKKVDFSQCEFISQNMWFYTYEDFCDNCFIIKRMFLNLDKNGRKFYMWYVYSNINMDEKHKNRIWDFLNINDQQSYLKLLEIKRRNK